MAGSVHGADLVLPRRWPLGEDVGESKLRRTLRTDAEIAAARRNVKETAWGRAELASALSRVRRWREMTDEQLWALVLPTTVPRRHYVNQLKGCPVHGTEIKKGNHFHPWRIDPIGHPWKVQCPVGKEWYPSNDFATGDTTGGEFPDDGFAYRAPDGEHYYFLAEYSELVHLHWVRPAVSSLARAYLLTGDSTYARKAAIMLLRIAEEYGHMATAIDDRARCDCGYPKVRPREPLSKPNGNGWVGFFTDRIWENANVVLFAEAYDNIFDALTAEDPELLTFLRLQREKALNGPQREIYSHLSRFPVPGSMVELRGFIEKNMLRVMAQGVLDRCIYGNDGMHQNAMITLALVLDSQRGTELVDWCYTGPGQMQFHLANYFFKDGSAYESLGGYNSIHIRGLNEVAMKLERLREWRPSLYPIDKYPAITDQTKHRALYDFPIRLVMGGSFTPIVGDTGGPPDLRRPAPIEVARDLAPHDYDLAYRLYEDPRYAQALASVRGKIPHPNLFRQPLDATVDQVIKTHGSRIDRSSDILDGYGLALLRSGQEDQRRTLSLLYGKLRGHAHDDFLDLALVGHGLSLMQCLGYPRSWHHSKRWEKNWATHYRVGVIGGKAAFKGATRAFADLPGLQYVDVVGLPFREDRRSGFERWRPLTGPVYRRRCALIDLSPTDFYVVDILEVAGGTEHYWSFHGLGEMTAFGVKPEHQQGGTLAGLSVPYGEYAKIRPREKQAFAFLENVRRARPTGLWGIDWKLGDTQNTHLRFTMVSPTDSEAILTTGRSPSGGTPYKLDFVFARRVGKAPLTSTFVSVIEAFAGERKIDRIEAVDGGLRVTAGDRVDTILLGEGDSGLDFDGDLGLWSEQGGTFRRAALVNGSRLTKNGLGVRMDKATLVGTVLDVDRARNAIAVSDLAMSCIGAGTFVMLRNDDRGSCYRVLDVAFRDGQHWLRISDDPLIGEGDATGFSDGRIHSKTHFPLANHRYYHGARVVGTGGEEYRVASVSAGGTVFLTERDTPAVNLREVFGEGGRFRIFDYGVGDTVHITNIAHVENTR